MPARKTIAILPFEVLGEHLPSGCAGLLIANALITKLSQLRECRVRPTSEVMQYNLRQHDTVAIATAMGLEYLLHGTIQRTADRVQVTVQLLSAKSGMLVWAESFEEPCHDIDCFDDSIADQIAGALALLLTTEQRKLMSRLYAADTEAYRLYLKGRFHWQQRTEAALKCATDFFHRALARDSQYAPAYSALAGSYALLPMLSAAPSPGLMARARAAAISALDIDDTLTEARSALAFVKWHGEWDWKGAEREFCRVLRFQSDHAITHQWYGLLLVELGRFDEAIAHARQSVALDPSLSIRANFVSVLHFAGRHEEAIAQAREILRLDPNSSRARYYLGLALEQQKLIGEAITALEGGDEKNFSDPHFLGALGHMKASADQRVEAERILARLQEPTAYHPNCVSLALVQLGLGNQDRTLELLERAVEHREFDLVLLKCDKRFAALRKLHPFQFILSRVGLTDALPD